MTEALFVILGSAITIASTFFFQWWNRRQERHDLARGLLVELRVGERASGPGSEVFELLRRLKAGQHVNPAIIRKVSSNTAGILNPIFHATADRLHLLDAAASQKLTEYYVRLAGTQRAGEVLADLIEAGFVWEETAQIAENIEASLTELYHLRAEAIRAIADTLPASHRPGRLIDPPGA
ncbi:hypothetical protein B5C34_13560 [Pacificimonas flava]|uniref:Uncharacterized protein n=2 Tax=Pacificimonas TaxID=1960290 RepID=A0A219B888_9SPHN|nr:MULTISPECIES: hypothetical protein [Pacificimonas]MBZ6379850.1 hypothetical protein [Pacificimonas aurantium]OWV34383.1 hypothetical protein B5C34_13560 [Pacificimonas flava]